MGPGVTSAGTRMDLTNSHENQRKRLSREITFSWNFRAPELGNGADVTLLTMAVAAVVVVGGMVFAKYGSNAGLPWWIYYPVPAVATLVVPPVAFKLYGKELLQYLVLAFLSSPAIHVAFSFLFDWHDYMPFIPVPSLKSLLGHAAAGI